MTNGHVRNTSKKKQFKDIVMSYEEDLLLLTLETDLAPRIDSIIQSIPDKVENDYFDDTSDIFDYFEEVDTPIGLEYTRIHVAISKKSNKFFVREISETQSNYSYSSYSTYARNNNGMIITPTFGTSSAYRYSDHEEGRKIIDFINKHYMIIRSNKNVNPPWYAQNDRKSYTGREKNPYITQTVKRKRK